MTHLSGFAGARQIFINDVPFTVQGMIEEGVVNIHSRKSSQGDPGPDDHPTDSTWNQTSWEGGGQVRYSKPDVGNNRFDWATLDTMQTNSLTLAPLATVYDDPTAVTTREAWILGDFASQVHGSWGSDLYRYNVGTGVWDDTGYNLTSVPVAKGTVYTLATGGSAGSKRLFIPEGSNSDMYTGAAISALGKSAVSFAVWDDKLFRLGTDGALEYTTDAVTWSGLVYLPDGSTPRKLLVYMNLGGDPALHIVTNGAVWGYDFTSGRMYMTQMQYPHHPDQGRASSVWRAEMQVGVGDGVHRYNRSTIGAMGLDRDDGLPMEYRGVIIDLEPSYNCLYALVSGQTIGTPAGDLYTLNLGGGDDQLYGSAGTVSSLLMRWNGFGWHFVDSMTGYAPTSCLVSDSGDHYAVWYAVNRKIRKVLLSRVYYNPKDDVTFPVAASGEFESMWYNYGWDGQSKIGKKIEMLVERASATETIQVQYKIDLDSNDWVTLGTITGAGEWTFYLGPDAGAPADSTAPVDYHGISFERCKLKFILARGSTTTNRPVIRWFSLIVRKYLRPQRTWRMVLDLTKGDKDYPPTVLRQALMDAVLAKRAADFVHQNELIKAELVALDFRETAGGTGLKYEARINLIESNELV
jgi:hypothetical protein